LLILENGQKNCGHRWWLIQSICQN